MKILAIYLIISCILVTINIITCTITKDEMFLEWINDLKELELNKLIKLMVLILIMISGILIVIPNNILEIITILKGDSDS